MNAKYGYNPRAYIGEFYAALESADLGWMPKISMLFNSKQESETYKWLGMTPAMREWIGGRQAKGWLQNAYTIPNKTFEATVDVSVDDLRRDNTGQLSLRINDLAARANDHWNDLLSTLILNTASATCYDGSTFFADAHSEGSSGSQDNNISIDISGLGCTNHGIITYPSAEEASLSIMQAISTIYGFLDDQGKPMNQNAKNFLVMCAPSLAPPFIAACTKPSLEYGSVNMTGPGGYFNVDFAINPLLSTWTVNFAIFRTDGTVKPFIRQEEEAPVMTYIGEGSEEEFKNNRHLYGVKAIRNAGFGYWQNAVKVTMT